MQRPLPERPEAEDVRFGEDQGADTEREDLRGPDAAYGGRDQRVGR